MNDKSRVRTMAGKQEMTAMIQIAGTLYTAGKFEYTPEWTEDQVLLAYGTGGVFALDNTTQLFAYHTTILGDFIQGPFIVLPEKASYYRDNDFFQDYVDIGPDSPRLRSIIKSQTTADDVSNVRCYVALEDFNGIQYSDRRAVIEKLQEDAAINTWLIVFNKQGDPMHGELIIIDPTFEDPEDSADNDCLILQMLRGSG